MSILFLEEYILRTTKLFCLLTAGIVTTGGIYFGSDIFISNQIEKLKRKTLPDYKYSERSTSNGRFQIYSQYFKKESILLEGKFGDELYERFQTNRACFLPLIRDLNDSSITKCFTWRFSRYLDVGKALPSRMIVSEFEDRNINCVLIFDPLKKEDKPEEITTTNLPVESEIYTGIYTLLRYFDHDNPRILKPIDSVYDEKLLHKDVTVYAKSFTGELNNDTKIVVLKQTSPDTYHYRFVIKFEDLSEDLKNSLIEKLKSSKDQKYRSKESYLSYISGGELTEEEKKQILLNEEIFEQEMKFKSMKFTH